MQPLFLDFQVFLKTQLSDETQVAWNVGQQACNDAHILSANESGDPMFVFHIAN